MPGRHRSRRRQPQSGTQSQRLAEISHQSSDRRIAEKPRRSSHFQFSRAIGIADSENQNFSPGDTEARLATKEGKQTETSHRQVHPSERIQVFNRQNYQRVHLRETSIGGFSSLLLVNFENATGRKREKIYGQGINILITYLEDSRNSFLCIEKLGDN